MTNQPAPLWEEQLVILCNERVGQLTHVIASVKAAIEHERTTSRRALLEELRGQAEKLKNPGVDLFLGTGGGRPFQDELDAWNEAVDKFLTLIDTKLKDI